MNGALGDSTKWRAATDAVTDMIGAYDASIAFGLMTFPQPAACGPGRLDVAPAVGHQSEITAVMKSPPPPYGAYTPLGESLMVAADPTQLPVAPEDVVVITDGFQWCDPYDPDARLFPVAAVRALHTRGTRTFVVGFGGGVDRSVLASMALEGGTAGAGCDVLANDPSKPPCYYQADDADALVAALMDVAASASTERCDGIDNDCDGVVDNGATCDAGATCTAGACEPLPVTPDAGVGSDAGIGGGYESAGQPGSCGCTAPGSSGSGLALVVATGFAMRRRRRTVSARAARADRAA